MKNSSRAAKGTVFHIYLSRQKRHGVFAKKEDKTSIEKEEP